MGTGEIFKVPQMQELAKKYNRTIAQICIRWSLQRGYLPLPKSVTPGRIRENTQVFDFELSADDVQKIADLKGIIGLSKNPDEISF
jgi:diketogulonate reductase-like aldo/keto reductase